MAPRVDAEVVARRVDISDQHQRYEALARLLAGDKVQVALVDGHGAGGWAGDAIMLPRTTDFAATYADNEFAVVAQLAWSCASRSLGFVRPANLAEPLALVATALAAPAIRRRMLLDAPALEDGLLALERQLAALPRPVIHDQALAAVGWLLQLAGSQGGVVPATPARVALTSGSAKVGLLWARDVLALAPRDGHGLAQALAQVEPLGAWPLRAARDLAALQAYWWWGRLLLEQRRNTVVTPPAGSMEPELIGTEGTERIKPLQKQIERIEEPNNTVAENPLVHSFEKVHTLDTYQGGSKRIDGDDELAMHQKALDELDLRQVVRSHRAARSLYRADIADQLGSSVNEELAEPSALAYDEWDAGRSEWRKGWCNLSAHPVPIAADADAQLRIMRAQMLRTTTACRAIFERFEAARAWQMRQRSGPNVDIDALVAYQASLRAGHANEPKVYALRRRHTRDSAVLLLLDASLSTDGWVANRRVIDVEKAAVLALGDALDGLFDDVAVAAFCSQTHRDCRFLMAKSFSESWHLGAQRLASLQPAGYTRIGPALRHGIAMLQSSSARRKLLLLLSDGKPSDLDRYEGRYGMADVRRAVQDGVAQGVFTYAIAVDPAARRWLPSMFGQGRATVVQHPTQLVDALAQITAAALKM